MQIQNPGNSSLICTILIVEDNEDDFELIDYQLSMGDGVKPLTEHCDCLAAAVSRLRNGGVDIILLDLSLPDSQGVDTVKSIRQLAPEVPIIVLSGSADVDIALKSLRYGAEDYLIKNNADNASLCRSINYALARHAARVANERLATIVEASDDAIIGKTLNGTITSWNKGAAALFGYSAEEATGHSIAMLFPPEADTELEEILGALRKGETIRDKETVRVNKKGERLDILQTVSPIIREDGTVSGAAAIDRDITERKKVQKGLLESEERYRLLVAGVKDYAILMIDANGIVESWNEGAKRLKGYEATEIIGKHFSTFYSADDQLLGLPDSHLKAAIALGSTEDQGWRIRKDGSSFLAEILITPLFSASGELRGFTKITRDITARKVAEQEIADTKLRLSLALEAAAVGVWDFDMVQNTVWRSLRHDEIFGHKEHLPAWNFDIFLTYVLPEDLGVARQAFNAAVEFGRLNMQCRIIRAGDGSVRWIAARGETIWDEEGRAVRMSGTIVDITDSREQQEQQRLLSIMKEREDFMATLTHDMKNPLIGANRLLEMFVDGGLGDLTSQQCELLQCLKESNGSLLKLIADLIDVYRMEKDVKNMHVTEFDFVTVIRSCSAGILPFAKLRSMTVTEDLPATFSLHADSSRLERVVQNLLDNALKFAPEGGLVKIRLSQVDGKVVLEIEDNGPGIPAAEQSLLFKRFSQGAVGKRYTGGSGLGLYLCKQIVEAHGGSIECQSQPHKITIFRVLLPETKPDRMELTV